jgi:hypothetical protein
LGISSFRWGIAQTEDLDARVREATPAREKGRERVSAPQTIEIPSPSETAQPGASQSQHPGIEDAVLDHLNADVQLEGSF